jgi:hypothetical protein
MKRIGIVIKRGRTVQMEPKDLLWQDKKTQMKKKKKIWVSKIIQLYPLRNQKRKKNMILKLGRIHQGVSTLVIWHVYS